MTAWESFWSWMSVSPRSVSPLQSARAHVNSVSEINRFHLLCHPGRPECHSSNLHHPVCVLPQTFTGPLVPGWKSDSHRADINRPVCHDHWSDHDRPLSSRLHTWCGDVLLCRCQHLWHGATWMKGMSLNCLTVLYSYSVAEWCIFCMLLSWWEAFASFKWNCWMLSVWGISFLYKKKIEIV